MAKTKTEIQNELKILIKGANYLPKSEKKRWLLIVDYLDLDELKDIFDHFSETAGKQKEFKLKMIHKANLGPQYINKIDEISRNHKVKANKEEEKYLSETSENPDEILNKIHQK